MRKLFVSLCLLTLVSTLGNGRPLRFALLNDVHVTPGNITDSLLRVAVAEINTLNPDLVVINGDLTNEGSDAELLNIKSILGGLTVPLYVLPGNHEDNWSQSATKTFVDLFGNDRFLFEKDSIVMVGINCGPYMKMGDGHVKQEDLHWLREVLERSASQGKQVISFNHYPIRKDDLDNWRQYADILLAGPVMAHISGHYHKWIRYEVDGMECIMTRALNVDGTHGYTIVDVTPDWLLFYEKQLGKDATPKYALHNHNHGAKVKVKKVKKEEAINTEYPATKVWADSASVFTRLAFDNDNVYFGTSTGKLKAVNKSTNKLSWQYNTGASVFSRAVPLEKGLVAFPTNDGILLIDGSTGKVRKSYPSAEGPYVADGLYQDGVYVQGSYKRFERRDPRSGKLIWVYDSLMNYCQAAPVIDKGEVVFGAWDTNLRNLDLKTGKLKWVWNNGKSANMLGPGNVVPVVTEDVVFIVAPDRYMTAIDRKTGTTIWRDNSYKYRESIGKSEDGNVIYAKTMDGKLVAVDARSPEFKELWNVDMGLGYEHAPCIILEKDGLVYAGSRQGIVTVVDPVKKEVVVSMPLGVSEVNGIDVDPYTGDIYVSLIEGTIFRLNVNSSND